MTKTKKQQPTFKQLIARYRERCRQRGERSLPINKLAKECHVSRPYFYLLQRGECVASDAVEENIADALGLAVSTVSRALAESRKRS